MMEDPEQPPSTGRSATSGSAGDPRALLVANGLVATMPVAPLPVADGRVEIGVADRVRAPAGGDRAALVRFAADALDALGRSSAELSVLLCDDRFMRDLNRRFRGIDAPTDVLSFEQDSTVGHGSVLGDVVISLDTARRQAQRRNLPEATELRELLLHGILHLLGRDHGDGDIADEPMLREQRRLLESLPWASCSAS